VFGLLGLFLGPFLISLLLVLVDIYKVEFRSELGAAEPSSGPETGLIGK